MATSPRRRKNPMEALLKRFGRIIDDGAKTMDAERLRESEKAFSDAVDHAIAKTDHNKGSRAATPPSKKKSAMNSLLKSMDELAVAASKEMTTDEVRKVRRQINGLVGRAVERKPRSETA